MPPLRQMQGLLGQAKGFKMPAYDEKKREALAKPTPAQIIPEDETDDQAERGLATMSRMMGVPVEQLRQRAGIKAPPGVGVTPPPTIAAPSGFQQGLFGNPGAGLLRGSYPTLAKAGGVAPTFPTTLDTPESQEAYQANLEQNAMREELRQQFPSRDQMQREAEFRLSPLSPLWGAVSQMGDQQKAGLLQEGLGEASRAYQAGLATQAGLLGQQTTRDLGLAELGSKQAQLAQREKEEERRYELDKEKAGREKYKDSPEYQTMLMEGADYTKTGYLPTTQQREDLREWAKSHARPGLFGGPPPIGVGGGPGPPAPPPEGPKKPSKSEFESQIDARIRKVLPRPQPGQQGPRPETAADITTILKDFSDEELATPKVYKELLQQLGSRFPTEWPKFQMATVSRVPAMRNEATRQLQRMDAAARKLGMGRKEAENALGTMANYAAAGGIAGGTAGLLGGPLAPITAPAGAALGMLGGGLVGGAEHLRRLIFE